MSKKQELDRQAFAALTDDRREVLQKIDELSRSTNLMESLRLNADGPTRLARRLYRDDKITRNDQRVDLLCDLIDHKWIVVTSSDNSRVSGNAVRYSVSEAYRELAVATV